MNTPNKSSIDWAARHGLITRPAPQKPKKRGRKAIPPSPAMQCVIDAYRKQCTMAELCALHGVSLKKAKYYLYDR